MSSNLVLASATAIFSACVITSGSDRYSLEFLETSRSPPQEPPDNGRDDVIYGRGVIGGDIILHDIPPLPPRYKMEADNIRAVEAESLQIEVLYVAVDYRDAADQQSWLCCCHNVIHS